MLPHRNINVLDQNIWATKANIIFPFSIFQSLILVRDDLISNCAGPKKKNRVSFSVGIKNIVSRHLEYFEYLITYSVGIKYIVSRH